MVYLKSKVIQQRFKRKDTTMNYRDTTMVYNNAKFYYEKGNGKTKRLIEGLSGVSPFKLRKALKSNEDFNNLRLNDIIKLEDVVTKVGENVKLDDKTE